MESTIVSLAIALGIQAVVLFVFVALLPLLFWRVFKQDEQITLLRLKLAAEIKEVETKITALDDQLADHLSMDPDYQEVPNP